MGTGYFYLLKAACPHLKKKRPAGTFVMSYKGPYKESDR